MTLTDVKNYLKIDYNEDDVYLELLISVSDDYILSMIGKGYMSAPNYIYKINLYKLLQYKLIYDMYNNRGTEIPNGTKQDRIVSNILELLGNY